MLNRDRREPRHCRDLIHPNQYVIAEL
ncbi:hypothetical protein CBM2586_A50453 [Cupriavidus phytorum]|uniref:Uncharacterized protein n=1 Tax=Cupriavidus taiwanensis TaxID=164546 RepID=A0A975X8K5_9BURK|nr:hypothetical protein CBM2586_A50453 [Cupriavidus taiwanensis]